MKKRTIYSGIFFTALSWCLIVTQGLAQNRPDVIETEYNNSNELFYIMPAPEWASSSAIELANLLPSLYNVAPGWSLREVSTERDEHGVFVKYYQNYNNYDVIGGDIIVKKDQAGRILHILGTLRNIDMNGRVEIDSTQAVNAAWAASGRSELHLDRDPSTGIAYDPEVRLVFAPENGVMKSQFKLCYEVRLTVADPDVLVYYINAATGEIIDHYSDIHHANATGISLYSGVKNFNTTATADGRYLTKDSVRNISAFNFGYLRYVRSLEGSCAGEVAAPFVYFYDENNLWTEDSVKAMVDVMWGMSKVYDYYLSVHSRNSYDGAGAEIKNRVHYDDQSFKDKVCPIDSLKNANPHRWNNASWNGKTMQYGQGDGTNFSDLVSIDVVGHEFTHAVVRKTADLIYRGESGALNESFADMFGACIEFYAKTGNWLMAEECYTPGSATADEMRDMSDPKNGGNPAWNGTQWDERCPDTYDGDFWKDPTNLAKDKGGVHYNSGVGNYWFYLLSAGGKDKNDKNDEYDVTAIGRNKAEKIAYRTLTKYLSSSSDYKQARKASLLAAEDLHGKESQEYKMVCEAWFAVNVGEKCCDSLELKFETDSVTCKGRKDGKIDLTVTNHRKGARDIDVTYKWYEIDTFGTVISTGQDLNGLAAKKYVVLVEDTVAKCEKLGDTTVYEPAELKINISGLGNHSGPCDRTFTITLTCQASGGTPEYTYSWDNQRREIQAGGRTGFRRYVAAAVVDDHGCVKANGGYVSYIPITCSYDPNDIIGPPAYGDQNWVSKFATLPYKIRYENDPKFASGPAQRVEIRHKLDSTVNINSFRLSDFGFYKYNFTVPTNSINYTTRLDIRDSFGIFLDVTAGVNSSTREAFWTFESIDPKTGLPPIDGSKGFLAINDTITHKGEGYVNYTIRPASFTKTGDSIRAIANIVFDDNPSINTPKIFNLIDALPPTTGIDSTGSIVDTLTFALNLNGKDDTGGSGLAGRDIYVSVNGGAFSLHTPNVTDSVFLFSGDYGNTYGFFTRGFDNTSNYEALKTTADIQITIAPDQFFKPIDSTTSLCAGDTLKLTWYATSLTSFNLEYTADSGMTFVPVATGVSVADTLYQWIIPSSISGKKFYWLRALEANGTVLDSSGSFELKEGPVVQLGPDTSFCQGESFSLQIDAGSGYSAYAWSNSATTQSITVNSTGTYSVEVTNSFGCKNDDVLVITEDLNPVTNNVVSSKPSCAGGNDGSIQLDVMSGSAPYMYKWSNGSTVEDISGISAGVYGLTVTDAKECKTTRSVTLTDPDAIAVGLFATAVKCFGTATGAVSSSVTGGTSPYSYKWSNSASTASLSGLSAGVYTVTVSDQKNCSTTAKVTITQPTALAVGTVVTHVLCNGAATGSVDLSISGGTSPYTYKWSNSATTQDLSSVAAGIYSVTATDNNACTVVTSAVINQPTVLTRTLTPVHVKCFGGNDGSVGLSVSGGTTPYQFKWSNSATSRDLTGLSAATYAVTITDANNCTITGSAAVNQPTVLSSSSTKSDVKCNGGNSGSIDVSVSGGTSPYSYKWSNNATTQDLSNLSVGTYTVTITDANLCTRTESATIGQPTALSIGTSITHVLCNGFTTGAVDLSVSGGVPGYTYKWSNGASTEDLSAIAAGSYSVTATDQNACTATTTAVVNQPVALSRTLTPVDVKCNGGNNGSISLSVSGGVSPYQYKWSNTATTKDLSGLTAATYSVTITDANNCSITGSASVGQPTILSSGFTKVDVLCNGNNTGSVDVTVSGGSSPYSYKWSNSATTQDLSNLVAGSYSVTITDANACSRTESVAITQPTALTIGSSITHVLCNGFNTGAVNVTVGGGVSPYSYRWSNGASSEDLSGITAGTYTVTATDQNACTITTTAAVNQPSALTRSLTAVDVKCNGGNDGSVTLSVSGGVSPYQYKWSNSASSKDLTNVSANTYSVTITDANNCSITGSATVGQPTALNTGATATAVKCNGGNDGSIDVTVSGGTSPYTYRWNTNATTQDLSNLSASVYSVTISDANLCSRVEVVTVTQPLALSSSTTVTPVLCNGNATGSIDLSVGGGTSPYTYLWSNGATNQDLSGVAAGTYRVTITDNNLCTRTDQGVVTEPPLLTGSNTVTPVLCNGGNDGAVDLTISGGVTPYTYVWSNSATTQDLNNITAGTYTVLVTDANNCIFRDTAVVSQPTALVLTKQVSDVQCFGGNDGAIDITVSGGVPSYTFAWTNGAVTEDINNLIFAVYSVVVTDGNNCKLYDTTTVGQPASPLSMTFAVDSVNCFGENSGSVLVNVNGGTSGYSYRWNNGATTQSINNLFAGRYIARITDANLCELVDSADLFEPDPLLAVLSASDVLCYAGSSGAVDVLVVGGTPSYSYNWSTGAITKDINNLTLGNYKVTVSDLNNCLYIDSVRVNQPVAPISSSVLQTAVKCYNGNDGGLDLNVNGGTMPYEFVWSNGASTEDLNGVPSGDYDVLIIDFNKCTHRDTGFVDQPLAPLSLTMSISDVKCFGGNDGSASIVVSGGTSPYTYLWSDGTNGTGIVNKITGIYYVTVTDANNCILIDTAAIGQPAAPLSTSINVTDVLCFGGNNGALDLSVSGGTSPYTFVWSNSANSEDIGTLITGSYNVLVTDANSCTIRDTGFVDQPTAPLSTNISINPVSCNGGNNGAIQMVVNGGTSPYTYLWSNGSANRDISTLTAGTYYVEIRDANDCILRDTVVVDEPALLTTSTFGTSATSDGENGSAWTIPVGGTSPYTFLWSDPSAQRTDTASGLVIGGYTVLVTDANGCTVRDSVWVPLAPDPSTINLFPNPTNGEITITNLDALGLEEPILIELIQMQGKVEQTFEVIGLSQYTFYLDNNLFNGMYLIRISNFRGAEHRKVVLTRQ